ncbi:MAG: VOC family protein [Phormidesmis sp.]
MTLASTQLPVQVDFYRAFLLLEPSLQTASYAEFSLPGLRLAIFVPKLDNKTDNVSVFSAESSGAMSLCLEVEDLSAVIARLRKLNYPPAGDIIHASHGQEIYAYDPDGNRLILHQAVAKAV